MVEITRRKLSISFTVNERIYEKMDNMVQSGEFSSISDVVNTSVSMLLGKISSNKMYLFTIEDADSKEDSLSKKITATLSKFVDNELTKLSTVENKNKSHIVRIALNDFFENYQSTDTNQNLDDPSSHALLNKIVQKVIKELESEKK